MKSCEIHHCNPRQRLKSMVVANLTEKLRKLDFWNGTDPFLNTHQYIYSGGIDGKNINPHA